MSTPNYPQSNLESGDQQDDAYGGAPANRFGTPARSFIDSCIQTIQRLILRHIRIPYGVHWVVCSSGCVAGDVAFFDEGQFVTAQGYYARNRTTGSGTAIMWGVWLDPTSAGAKARVVVCGPVSPSVTGLGVQTAGTHVSVNTSTGRLQVAGVGDPIVGYFDVQGNVFLLSPGRLV
jgi:hypothetical protein